MSDTDCENRKICTDEHELFITSPVRSVIVAETKSSGTAFASTKTAFFRWDFFANRRMQIDEKVMNGKLAGAANGGELHPGVFALFFIINQM